MSVKDDESKFSTSSRSILSKEEEDDCSRSNLSSSPPKSERQMSFLGSKLEKAAAVSNIGISNFNSSSSSTCNESTLPISIQLLGNTKDIKNMEWSNVQQLLKETKCQTNAGLLLALKTKKSSKGLNRSKSCGTKKSNVDNINRNEPSVVVKEDKNSNQTRQRQQKRHSLSSIKSTIDSLSSELNLAFEQEEVDRDYE